MSKSKIGNLVYVTPLQKKSHRKNVKNIVDCRLGTVISEGITPLYPDLGSCFQVVVNNNVEFFFMYELQIIDTDEPQ